MPASPPSGCGSGQVDVFETKHMLVPRSQQLEFTPAPGQLFWQSRSDVQLGGHTGPASTLPPELALVAEAAPVPPPMPPSKNSVSLPEAQATTTAEGIRARA